MAKAQWLTASPQSGNGNGSIVNTATVHTGRNVRTTVVTVTAAGVKDPVTYSVTQKAKPEFVSFNNGSEMSAPKTGGIVDIKGKSNSKKLTYSLVGEAFGVDLPTDYTANGLETKNGQAIAGDPGASSEYASSMKFTFPKNETIKERTLTVKVDSESGETAQIQVKQAAGDPVISVTPTSITLEASGAGVNVTVKSNTSWTVS